MQNRLFCALLLLAGFVLPAHTQIVEAPHPIALHAGGGEVTFTLSDGDPKGTAPIPLALSTGPILDTATQTVIKGAAATITSIAADAKVPSSLAPGDTLWLKATVTGVSGASNAEFPVFNGVSQLGKLSAFAGDAPLTISVDGDGAASDKPLAYSFGNPVVIALKNSDAESYHLHWIFEINNQPESSNDIYVPASGNYSITVKPTCKHFSLFNWIRGTNNVTNPPSCEPFSLLDWIHPSSRNGVLRLSVISPTDAAHHPIVPDGLLPTRSLSISLAMQPLTAFWSGIWSYSYVVILLLIGGLFSFLASSMLPNMQRRGQLRAQLEDLATRTSTISTNIDSYLRVMLRLERKRISIMMDKANPWIPASSDPLVLAAASIDNLGKRIAGAERLDELRRKHRQISETAPPSVVDGIDADLQAAADQLHSIALSDAVIAATNGYLAKAQAALDTLDDSDALAKQIAGNVSLVMKRFEKFPPNYYADLKASLAGVFLIVDPTRGYNDAKNIVRPMLRAIDHGAAAAQLALDYAMIRASLPIMPTVQGPPHAPPEGAPPVPADAPPPIPADSASQCATPWETKRERLRQRHCLLLALLGELSWRALRDATLLVQEMREDIYEEDILEEIIKPCQAEIFFDTQKARPIQPVFFSIKFKNSRFNDAAALQRLICHWTFPNDLNEYTWKVCHYFSGFEPATIPPTECKQSKPPQAGAASTTPAAKQEEVVKLKNDSYKPLRSFRLSTSPIKRELDVYATIRGQQVDEAREVPVPPLKMTIQIESVPNTERSLFWAEVLRFAIAFGVALAGLLSGALDQLKKLDVIPASIAIIGLGFSASAIKNLLTQSAGPQTPGPTPAPTPATPPPTAQK